ncbi:MAG: ferritin-like fold-containing protein [Actinomycetes bacterium]|jgi:hypothetical protein
MINESSATAERMYEEAVVELLGVLAYGELTAFERMAADAALAPGIQVQASLAGLAALQYDHFVVLRDRLTQMGADPATAMTPFRPAIDAFHAQTRPHDWLEGLMKAYVGDGITADFYREIAQHLDPRTKDLVIAVCDDLEAADFIVETVREAIAEDPRVAGRLALWGRRLVGEMIAQAQLVAAEHDVLSMLVIGGVHRPGVDLAELGQMMSRLEANHARRMAALSLAS